MEVLVDFRKITPEGKVWCGGINTILATRSDLATARIIRDESLQTEHGLLWGYKGFIQWRRITAEVTPNLEAFGPNDILLKRTYRWEQKRHPECTEPIVQENKLAGADVPWLGFYERWRAWVYNPVVRSSAGNWINQFAVTLPKYFEIFSKYDGVIADDEMDFAYRQWCCIAELLLNPSQVRWLIHKTTCRGKTCIAVSAMPIRIAECLGWHAPKGHKRPKWQPVPTNLVEIPVAEK